MGIWYAPGKEDREDYNDMTEADVKRFGLILAVQAEIEGMKAYNIKNPDTVGYQQHDFDYKASEIREIVNKHPDQL